jgi:hypothetical protein
MILIIEHIYVNSLCLTQIPIDFMNRIIYLIAICFIFISANGQVDIDKSINLTGGLGNSRISGISDVSNPKDAVSVEKLQNGNLVYGVASPGPNAYTLTFTPAIASFIPGTTITFKAQGTNTAAVTLNGISLLKDVSTSLAAGDIQTGQMVTAVYDGSNFQLVSRTYVNNTGGTVTAVTGTAPIVSSGGNTPAISITAATTSTAGSMSAADKAKLNAITGTNTGDQTITLTQDVTGSGTGSFATTIAPNAVTSAKILDGEIVNGDINISAAIADTKLATISSIGKVSNTATTATALNNVNTIVLRDGSGNFSAGTISAALNGNAATATTASNFSGSLAGDVSGAQSATVIGTGKVTNAMLAGSIDLTTKVAGILPVANGGTGIGSTYTIGDLVYASAAGTLSKLPDVATGKVLISGGVGVAPSWSKVDLAAHVSGNLPITNLNSGSNAGANTFWRGDGTWSVPAGTGVTGSGTSTQVAFWNSASSISSSAGLYWDNTNGRLGIGTAAPSAALNVVSNGVPQMLVSPLGGGTSTTSLPAFLDFYSTFDAFPSDQGPRRTASIKAKYTGGVWGNETLIFEVGASNDAAIEPTERMRIAGNGNVSLTTLTGSGNAPVMADASGVLYRQAGGWITKDLKSVTAVGPTAAAASGGSYATILTTTVTTTSTSDKIIVWVSGYSQQDNNDDPSVQYYVSEGTNVSEVLQSGLNGATNSAYTHGTLMNGCFFLAAAAAGTRTITLNARRSNASGGTTYLYNYRITAEVKGQ